MSVSIYKYFISKFFRLTPVLFLFYLSIGEFSTNFQTLSFLSFNLSYIIIYYWVLKSPQILGYGFIFLAGLVNDVVLSYTLGLSSLTYLSVAAFAAYIRNVTVRVSLLSDWLTFVIAVLVANFIYMVAFSVFTDFSLNYINLLLNSLITFSIYPVVWFLFELLRNFMKEFANV